MRLTPCPECGEMPDSPTWIRHARCVSVREGNRDAILKALMEWYEEEPTGDHWVLLGQTIRLIVAMT